MMVSLTYGFSMPILFPIVLCQLIVSYIVDKLALVYYYRKPPMYDDTISKNSIQILKWGAFFYSGMAFWSLSNK